jgi:peptidoglycan/xylan/chitin deacetylase (PgdA/CDA1 family)
MTRTSSLSLDLDNEWSYLKTRGDDAWRDHPSYLDTVVPRALDVLRDAGLRITFFIVGTDADRADDRSVLASISDAGHEIGNHSYRHEPWLHRYSEAELDEELARAEDAIEGATGVMPNGFRGPGYSLSLPTLRVLRRRGYRYDASTLPTYLGPLARTFYFRRARLDAEQRAEREHLFGTWSDGRRPLRPYRFAVDGGTLLELPVTTFPGVKVPIHVSYLLYLAARSRTAARAYFAVALEACRRTGIEPSLLLHPLDLLDADDVPSLGFFPAMAMPSPVKRELVTGFLAQLQDRFDVVPMGEHVRRLERRVLPVVEPRFATDEPVTREVAA